LRPSLAKPGQFRNSQSRLGDAVYLPLSRVFVGRRGRLNAFIDQVAPRFR